MTLAERIIGRVKEREAFGLAKYGKPLYFHADKRDWLIEAYEEALDLLFYLEAAIARRARHTTYNKSAKYKVKQKRYEQSPAGRAKRKRDNAKRKEAKTWWVRQSRKAAKIKTAIL